jgi:long-chain fatty acid transport protein
VTYRSGFELEYEGDARLGGAPMAVPPRDDLETAIEFPHIVAFAYGVELTERLRIEADVEWLEWSSNDALDLDVNRYTGLIPPELRNDWDDTWTFALGGDYRVNDVWRLYAGYAYLETPVPDGTYVPIVADADRHVFSIGAEWQRAGQTIGVAYAASVFEDRDVTDNVNPGLNGTYTYEAHLVSVTYAMDW